MNTENHLNAYVSNKASSPKTVHNVYFRSCFTKVEMELDVKSLFC
jgi:hypothetical protein